MAKKAPSTSEMADLVEKATGREVVKVEKETKQKSTDKQKIKEAFEEATGGKAKVEEVSKEKAESIKSGSKMEDVVEKATGRNATVTDVSVISKGKSEKQKNAENLPEPETKKQRETIQQLQEIEKAKQGGLTRAERRKLQRGQQQLQQLSQAEFARQEQKGIESAQEKLSEAEKRIREARTGARFGEEGLTKGEALKKIKGHRKKLKEAKGKLETAESEAERKAGIWGKLEKVSPIYGGKTYESLSLGEKLVTGAKTAFSPRAFELIAAPHFEDKKAQDVVKEEFQQTQRESAKYGTRRASSMAAMRSLGSPTGIAGVGIATGSVYQAAIQTAASIGGPTAAAFSKAGAGVVGTTLALRRGKDIYQDIESGKYTKGTAKGLQFGLGALSFAAGSRAMKPEVKSTQVERSRTNLRSVKGTNKAVGKGSASVKQTLKVPKLLRKPATKTRFTELRFSDIQAGAKTSYAAGRAFQTSPEGRLIGTKEFVTSSLKTGKSFESIVTPKGKVSVSGEPLAQYTTKTQYQGGRTQFDQAFIAKTGQITKPGVGKTIFTKGVSGGKPGVTYTSGRTTILEPQKFKVSKFRPNYRGFKGSVSRTTSGEGLSFTEEVGTVPEVVPNIKGMSVMLGSVSGTTTAATASTPSAVQEVVETEEEQETEAPKVEKSEQQLETVSKEEAKLATTQTEETQTREKEEALGETTTQKEATDVKQGLKKGRVSVLERELSEEQGLKKRAGIKTGITPSFKTVEIPAVGITEIPKIKFRQWQKLTQKFAEPSLITPTTPRATTPSTKGGLPLGLPDLGRVSAPDVTPETGRKALKGKRELIPQLDVLSATFAEQQVGKATTPTGKKAKREFAQPSTTIKGFKSVEERKGRVKTEFFNKKKEVKFF